MVEENGELTRVAPETDFAERLRGFGPLGLVSIILILIAGNDHILPLSAILVLVWARWSHTSLSDLGFVRPESWIRTLVGGIVFGCAFKLVMKAIVMPLLGAEPINRAFHFLAGNRAALPGMVFAVIVVAGFGEETLFRGYLFERLGKLLGQSVWAKTFIVVITAIWFGVAHYAVQGLAGTEQATIVGLVFGTIFAVTGRIWMLMIAHASFDLTAVALIYWNLEVGVAQFFFK